VFPCCSCKVVSLPVKCMQETKCGEKSNHDVLHFVTIEFTNSPYSLAHKSNQLNPLALTLLRYYPCSYHRRSSPFCTCFWARSSRIVLDLLIAISLTPTACAALFYVFTATVSNSLSSSPSSAAAGFLSFCLQYDASHRVRHGPLGHSSRLVGA
jgi:hypothetical protein